MVELKTKKNNANVRDFLNSVEHESRRADGLRLLKIFTQATGMRPKMWGASIVGFGQYHYKSDRSRQEGDWMLTGFSPRKKSLSLYVLSGFKEQEALIKKLGTCKAAVGCLYVNKLTDIDEKVLVDLIKKSVAHMQKLHSAT